MKANQPRAAQAPGSATARPAAPPAKASATPRAVMNTAALGVDDPASPAIAGFAEMLALYRASTRHLREPVGRIIERVARAHDMLPAHITGDQRSKHFVRARYAAIAEVRRIYPEKSLPWLGRQFNRDHTTILHALRKMGLHP